MKYNEINQESIQKLMHSFYHKIRNDGGKLGEIFRSKIGTSDEEWRNHEAKIGGFWEGMLLGTGSYEGQPLKVHMELDPFPRELFEVWLEYFETSLNEIYSPHCVAPILQRAQMIARRFQSALYGYSS